MSDAPFDSEHLNARNWERLLLATLVRVRDHLPGPGMTEDEIEHIDARLRDRARLGIDIDQILEMAKDRGSL